MCIRDRQWTKALKTSTLAQYATETGHNIDFDPTKLLDAELLTRRNASIREVIEIEKRSQMISINKMITCNFSLETDTSCLHHPSDTTGRLINHLKDMNLAINQ